jgi:histidine ammonia-lyase
VPLGLGFLPPLKPGVGIKEAYRALREQIRPVKGDRRLSGHIEKIQSLIGSGESPNRVGKFSRGSG